MLREEDGTPDGLRNLMMERLLPAVESSRRRLLCHTQTVGEETRQNAVETERHQFTELCFCLRGRAEMWLGTQVAICEENQLVIIPSGVQHSTGLLHSVISAPNEVFSWLVWISVFPFGATINLCESAGGVHRSTPRRLLLSPYTQSCADQMLAELQPAQSADELVIKYAFLHMIVGLWRGQTAQADCLPDELTAAPVVLPSAGVRLSERVIQQLRRQYYQPSLGLDALAHSVGTSKSHLARQFKRETGLTVTEYLNKVRMDAAKRLLLAGLKVTTVAEYVGFSDAYYFSRVFTRATGCPPSAYRQRAAE